MNNANNYYGAVIIKDTVELRKLLKKHRPTNMELTYEKDGKLTTMNIYTEDEKLFYFDGKVPDDLKSRSMRFYPDELFESN